MIKLKNFISEDASNSRNRQTAKDLVISILGNKVSFGDDFSAPIILSGTWSGGNIFVGFEEGKRRTGSIGLIDIEGGGPFQLAAAVHESFHAIIWLRGGKENDEFLANKMSREWIQKNIFDNDLKKEMLQDVDKSDKSYITHPHLAVRSKAKNLQ